MGNLDFGYSATHPGELLKEEIEARGISQRKLAEKLGISHTVLNDILNGRRALTASTALLFEAALNISADLLMRIQMKYNMQTMRQDKTFSDRLNDIRKLCAVL